MKIKNRISDEGTWALHSPDTTQSLKRDNEEDKNRISLTKTRAPGPVLV